LNEFLFFPFSVSCLVLVMSLYIMFFRVGSTFSFARFVCNLPGLHRRDIFLIFALIAVGVLSLSSPDFPISVFFMVLYSRFLLVSSYMTM
jgi:hypothetical protein